MGDLARRWWRRETWTTAAAHAVRSNGVVLEEMRAQNRATMEAVEASRVALGEKIDAFAREMRHRREVLETAVRQNSADIRMNGEDIRTSAGCARESKRWAPSIDV